MRSKCNVHNFGYRGMGTCLCRCKQRYQWLRLRDIRCLPEKVLQKVFAIAASTTTLLTSFLVLKKCLRLELSVCAKSYKSATHSMLQNALRGEYGKVATNCIPIYKSPITCNHGEINPPKMPIHLRKATIFSIMVSNSFGPTITPAIDLSRLALGQLVRNSFDWFVGLFCFSCLLACINVCACS